MPHRIHSVYSAVEVKERSDNLKTVFADPRWPSERVDRQWRVRVASSFDPEGHSTALSSQIAEYVHNNTIHLHFIYFEIK